MNVCVLPPPSPECSDGGHFGEQLPRLQVKAMPAEAVASSMTSSGCSMPPKPFANDQSGSTASKVFDKMSSP